VAVPHLRRLSDGRSSGERPSTPTKEGTAIKTAPIVRLADTTDAVVLADLPDEIVLALADIAGEAREGYGR
jgi:hypothetical protein